MSDENKKYFENEIKYFIIRERYLWYIQKLDFCLIDRVYIPLWSEKALVKDQSDIGDPIWLTAHIVRKGT